MAGHKIKGRLEALQLQHWVRAVANGSPPTVRDDATGQPKELKLPLAISDGEGLTFTLSRSGTASWILRYRYGGRAKEVTLGNFPDISLGDARKLAREKRAEIDQGKDPASEKRQAVMRAQNDWTVRQLIQDYRDKVLLELALSTQRSYSRSLERLEAKIGGLLVTTINPHDIIGLLENRKLTWSESQTMLCAAKMLFKHAAGRKLILINPCAGIDLTAIRGKRPPIRRRLMLTDAELATLFKASMRAETNLAIRILLATAARSDELFGARWEHIDFDHGIWHIPSSKTGPGIDVPLTEQTTTWFQQLKALARKSGFVLPARRETRKKRFAGDAQINKDTVRAAIDYWKENTSPAPEIRRFTPHDLRSTAKSHMRALGIPSDITEMCLNHKLAGIEGIYDVHTYFEERKAALTRWNDHLSSLGA